jgi:Holliday junction DNA helicase RuvA
MPTAPGFVLPSPVAPAVAEDAISALLNLGYRRPEVQPVVARTVERLGGDPAQLDTVIRESLKDLAQRTAG